MWERVTICGMAELVFRQGGSGRIICTVDESTSRLWCEQMSGDWWVEYSDVNSAVSAFERWWLTHSRDGGIA